MSRSNIICVDDEKIVLHSLREQLKSEFGADYNIEIAESAQEALGLFEEFCEAKEDIPLIISDYIMPSMKGDELLRRIRGINPKTVAILLTGQASLQGITNAVNYGGVFKCITKPWDKEALYSSVSDALAYYYNDRLSEENNKKLRLINCELEQTVQEKTQELTKKRKLLESDDKVSYISRLVEDISNEVSNSLFLIKSGADMIHTNKKNIYESNPESIAMYMKSIDDFYKTTSTVIESLVTAFDRNTIEYISQPTGRHAWEGILDKTSSIRSRISGSADGLLNKIKDFEKQFDKCIEKVAAWEDEEINVFNIEDVLYFTSEGGNTFVETKTGKYKMRDTLDLLETKFSTQNFFRCHRGFLINLNYISKIIPWIGNNYLLKLKGSSSEIPISRNRLKDMKRILGI